MDKMSPQALREAAQTSKAWPFEEARKLIARLERSERKEVIFETGYGPSGLPHLGTFGEVARTNMVRHAFRGLVGESVKTRLIAFSDDMDALRKIPDNVPNRDMMVLHLGKPLSQVPDPFGQYASFAEHNNARLRAFLDQFGFEYEFMSSTECYKSGRFDRALLRMLECFDEVQAIMLPSLGEERAATYSPFLPIHPRTGVVMQVPVLERRRDLGAIRWRDPSTGEEFETLVTGGHCKLQWKPDWAMRWMALSVDYEMSGKDLIPSVALAQKIVRVLGGTPPEGFSYELFLDEHGQKISKSKGNGLAVEDWLRYAPPESLSLYMYQQPRRAKRLYFDVIPRAVDEYVAFVERFPGEPVQLQLENPAWHIHSGKPPALDNPISFNMLLNLAGVAHAEQPSVLWGFISRYAPDATPANQPFLDRLVGYAIAYYQDFVKPTKRFRAPDATERAALEDLAAALEGLPNDTTAEALQNQVYEIGKRHPFVELRDWFKGIYAVLFGQEEGPRMGSFIALYGIEETRTLIADALAGRLTDK